MIRSLQLLTTINPLTTSTILRNFHNILNNRSTDSLKTIKSYKKNKFQFQDFLAVKKLIKLSILPLICIRRPSLKAMVSKLLFKRKNKNKPSSILKRLKAQCHDQNNYWIMLKYKYWILILFKRQNSKWKLKSNII